jgi:hypothetical protein
MLELCRSLRPTAEREPLVAEPLHTITAPSPPVGRIATAAYWLDDARSAALASRAVVGEMMRVSIADVRQDPPDGGGVARDLHAGSATAAKYTMVNLTIGYSTTPGGTGLTGDRVQVPEIPAGESTGVPP